MIITRFPGEMLHSHAIRRHRLEIGVSELADKFFPGGDNGPLTSLRLPMPKQRWNAIAAERFWTLHDATAWPLWGLLTGQDLSQFGWTLRYERLGRRLIRERYLKFCDVCAREQHKESSISWWMRDANLPFIAVCPKHCVSLSSAMIEHIMAGAGALPYELIKDSKPVVSHVDDRALQIARSIITLCAESPLIDTSVLLDVAKANKKFVANNLKFREALGVSAEYVLDGRCAPYQRLFSDENLDESLAAIMIFSCTSNEALAQLLRVSSGPRSLGPEVVTE